MSQKKSVALNGSEDPIVSRAAVIGKPDPHEQIDILLCLRFNPSGIKPQALEKFTDTPASQIKHHSHEKFAELFAASLADVEKVKTFAREYDLSLAEVNMVQRTVSLVGTVEAMSAAFGVKLCTYRHGDEEGEVVFRGHSGTVHIPGELDNIVLGVLGLSNPIIKKHRLQYNLIHPPKAIPLHPEAESPYFTPPEVARIYNFPADVTGKGQTIGIIESGGGYKIKYLRDYFEKYLGMPTPKITSVSMGGGHNNPGVNFIADAEVCLDIEVVGAIAPDAHIVVYFAPDSTFSGLYKAIQYAIHDKTHKNTVISLSWGQKEADNNAIYLALINQLMQAAAHLGITICASSGDFGSSDTPPNLKTDGYAHVDFPASSPWVLACGGTRLKACGKKSKIESEVVWNDGEIAATGGGVSTYFSSPSYQEKAGISPKSVNKDAGTGRGVPDVAGNASHETGYIIKVNEHPLINMAGTSSVAPLWAALIALLNQKLDKQLGFINPYLYQISESEGAFNDITRGNNQNIKSTPGYSAGSGWDACTGFGSPNGEKLFEAIRKMMKDKK
jgi:kumamolisin